MCKALAYSNISNEYAGLNETLHCLIYNSIDVVAIVFPPLRLLHTIYITREIKKVYGYLELFLTLKL